MEHDNEIQGGQNSYTTEFIQYDPRLGRWKSLDPLMGMFPHMSPYVGFDNNPVYYNDPYGLSSNAPGEPIKRGDDVSWTTDEAFRKKTLFSIKDAANSDEVVIIYKTSKGTKTYTFNYNSDTKMWDQEETYHGGNSSIRLGKYGSSASNLMKPELKDVITTTDNTLTAGDGAALVENVLQTKEGIVISDDSYKTADGVKNEKFVAKNGKTKRLYQESGSLVKNTPGVRMMKKLQVIDGVLGPVGTISDISELGYAIADGDVGKATEKIVLMGIDAVADRLLMTPTPATVALGVVIKGALFIYENWDSFVDFFTKGKPIFREPANPYPVDGIYYDNLSPEKYKPFTVNDFNSGFY